MHHTKNVMPAMGTTVAFSVNKCRLFEKGVSDPAIHGKENAHLVNREPNCWQRYEAKEEEAQEVSRCDPRRFGETIGCPI